MTAKHSADFNAAPAVRGTEDWIDNAFLGDWSKGHVPKRHHVTGADTLGKPTIGYSVTLEAVPDYLNMRNASGWNEALDGNGGRTMAAARRTRVVHAGQGDAACYSGSVFVNATRPDSTSFLANPAGQLFCGDMFAGQDGVYLNPREIVLHDQGKDVAAIGDVTRLNRTNDTGAKAAFWSGYRVQSEGTKPIDTGYAVVGPCRIGMEFSFAGTENVLVTKAGQKWRGNANGCDPTNLSRYSSDVGQEYIGYENGAWTIKGGVTLPGLPTAPAGLPSGGLWRDANGFLRVT
jgi:hypothetical protein